MNKVAAKPLRHEFHAFRRMKVPRLIFITGPCRSGKTTVGRLLGSMKGVEFVEEPWTGLILPVMQKLGLIGRREAGSMLGAYIEELFNDTILLRNANFRRSDWSSIWRFKDKKEIDYRLDKLRSRQDVIDHVEKNRSVFVIALTQASPAIDFLKEALPQALIIHTVREALPVALDKDWIRRSAFLTDAYFRKALDNNLYWDLKPGFSLPWWVPRSRAKEFLALPVAGRRLFYWLMLHEGGAKAAAKLKRKGPKDYWKLGYETLAKDPLAVVARVERTIGGKRTPRTREIAREILSRPPAEMTSADLRTIDSKLLAEVSRLQVRLGYPPLV